MAERLDRGRPVGGGAHDDADAGAREQQIERGEHGQRHGAHEQPVERIVGLEDREGGKAHVVGHLVADQRIAVEQLDHLLDDEGEAEGQQQLVRVPVFVHAAQHVALDQDADQPGDEGCQDEPEPESAMPRQGEPDIGAEHVEPGMGEIEHAHHAEDQRQPRRHHEEQQAVNDAVQDRDDDVFQGGPSPMNLECEETGGRRCLVPIRGRQGSGRRLRSAGVRPAGAPSCSSAGQGWLPRSPVSSLMVLKPMSVSSALNLASLETTATASGSSA